jgi:GR25 family glycosyltransferase involved in LPS biosynthesis
LYNKFKNRFTYYENGKKLENVDQVYSIVMPDRVNYMKKKLNEIGISYTLFNAITPNDLTPEDYTALTGSERFVVKKTRLPVQLSFTMCYLDAIKRGYSTIVIFEDDIVINAENKIVIPSISEFLKSDYAMFYMGYCELECNQVFNNKEHKYIVNVPDYSKLWCCHAICYKVKYLPELIEYMYPMVNEFDIRITEFLKEKGYRVCIPKKMYYDQNKNLGTNNETVYENGKLILSGPSCVID